MIRILSKNVPLLGAFVILASALLFISSRAPEEGGAVFDSELPALTLPHGALLAAPVRPDFILEAYRDEALQEGVIAFFGALAGSEELAVVILDNAELFNISPALAFALCWEESRYNPWALNRGNRDKTVDRGLFQLNNASFPKLAEEDFFDPAVNAYFGMGHFRWCLDTGGSEVAGLAMYNAGTNRVRSGGAPKVTLDYTGRILEARRKIEDLFRPEYARLTALLVSEPDPEPSPFNLALLSPLGRRGR